MLVELPRTGDVRAEFSPDGSQIVIAGKTRLEVMPCIPCLPLKTLEERASRSCPHGDQFLRNTAWMRLVLASGTTWVLARLPLLHR